MTCPRSNVLQTTLPVPSFCYIPTELRSKASSSSSSSALSLSEDVSLHHQMMRTSLVLATAVIFLLALTTMEAEAIRLDAETRAASVSSQQVVANKPSENLPQKDAPGTTSSVTSESETKQRSIAANEIKATAHKLPEFHEDYYGASVHEPRHH